MKPFDKEAFMCGAVAISYDGGEVQYLTTLNRELNYPIVVKVIDPKNGFEAIEYLTEDFKMSLGDDDTFAVGMKPVVTAYYIGVDEWDYHSPGERYTTKAFSDKQMVIDLGYAEKNIVAVKLEE